MINITVVPKTAENAAYFRNEFPFDGDITKKYSCQVVGSNLPSPRIIKFITKVEGGIPQNYIVLEFEGRCNQTQICLLFRTQTEVVEENKVAFMTWLLGYFTWFNFIFRIFSLKSLKFITKAIAVGIAVPVAFGLVFAATEYTYEGITGDDFEDSAIVEYWSNFTIPAIGRYFREDAMDDAGDFRDFVKEKTGDAIDATKETAEDLKDKGADFIDDIKD